jgi:hypothetical protein
MRITMSRFLWRIIDDGTEYQGIFVQIMTDKGKGKR